MEKGAFPCDALKHNNTKTPEVHAAVVVSVLEHLRSLRGTERETGEGGGEREGEREGGGGEREREGERGGEREGERERGDRGRERGKGSSAPYNQCICP